MLQAVEPPCGRSIGTTSTDREAGLRRVPPQRADPQAAPVAAVSGSPIAPGRQPTRRSRRSGSASAGAVNASATHSSIISTDPPSASIVRAARSALDLAGQVEPAGQPRIRGGVATVNDRDHEGAVGGKHPGRMFSRRRVLPRSPMRMVPSHVTLPLHRFVGAPGRCRVAARPPPLRQGRSRTVLRIRQR